MENRIVKVKIFDREKYTQDAQKEAVQILNRKFGLKLKNLEEFNINDLTDYFCRYPSLVPISPEERINKIIEDNLTIKKGDYAKILEYILVGTAFNNGELFLIVCDKDGKNIMPISPVNCEIKMEN